MPISLLSRIHLDDAIAVPGKPHRETFAPSSSD